MKYKYNGQWYDLSCSLNVSNLLIGEIIEYAGESIPGGYLVCDGSAVSRTEYSELFDVIGTLYGSGDGSTTFNLPDLRGRVVTGLNTTNSNFNVLGKTGGGQAHNNLQPYITINYLIRAKKTKNVLASGSTVVNSLSGDSTVDAPSVRAVNEEFSNVKGKILWINPNPTNNFGAQTIAIDFSNYDMYEVVFYQSTTHNERELTSGRIRTQKGSVLNYVPNNIFRAWNCTNSNISFESISDNNNLIPAYIIGYKTGLFS